MSSVQTEVVVEAPVSRAFEVFTKRMGAWWPASHHIGKVDMKDVVISAADDRWYEVGIDGSECNWGRVLVWDPPHRLVLGWQLTFEWQHDPDFLTEVEVNFTPMGESRTRVALEHRNLERFGMKEEEVRKSVGSDGGWPMIMREFAKMASERVATSA